MISHWFTSPLHVVYSGLQGTAYTDPIMLQAPSLPPSPAGPLISSGADPSTAQRDCLQWIEDYRPQLTPNSEGPDAFPRYIGCLDLRLSRTDRLQDLTIDNLGTRGPHWLGHSSPGMGPSVSYTRDALNQWGFPTEFVDAQLRDFVSLSLPGRRLYQRSVLLVACGDAIAVAHTHPAEFSHSVMFMTLGGPSTSNDDSLQTPRELPRDAPPSSLPASPPPSPSDKCEVLDGIAPPADVVIPQCTALDVSRDSRALLKTEVEPTSLQVQAQVYAEGPRPFVDISSPQPPSNNRVAVNPAPMHGSWQSRCTAFVARNGLSLVHTPLSMENSIVRGSSKSKRHLKVVVLHFKRALGFATGLECYMGNAATVNINVELVYQFALAVAHWAIELGVCPPPTLVVVLDPALWTSIATHGLFVELDLTPLDHQDSRRNRVAQVIGNYEISVVGVDGEGQGWCTCGRCVRPHPTSCQITHVQIGLFFTHKEYEPVVICDYHDSVQQWVPLLLEHSSTAGGGLRRWWS